MAHCKKQTKTSQNNTPKIRNTEYRALKSGGGSSGISPNLQWVGRTGYAPTQWVCPATSTQTTLHDDPNP